MTSKEYNILLKSPEWQNKRKIILSRDKYKCRHCENKNNLHVHHLYYINNKKPWEVPNTALITLCAKCHYEEHKGRKIQSFILKATKAKSKSKKDKNADRINKMKTMLSKKDRELQLKYDKLK